MYLHLQTNYKKYSRMKQYYKIACGLVLLLLLTLQSQAQVSLKIDLLSDGETYQVSLLAEEDWDGSKGLTATAQVTLVVPTGGFDLSNLESVTGTWLNNANIMSPTENSSFDYYNIGLASLGTQAIPYVKDQEVVLFRFQNGGECMGPVALMEDNDPFKVPNSLSANVGNQLTTLGSGNINAWKGNYGGAANCAIPSEATEGEVTFIIDLLDDGETYQVAMEPKQDWNGVHGLTSTAQITLTVPSGGFELVDLYSVNGSWSSNATILSPSDNANIDYINVGLVSLGTDAIGYAKNEPTVLFTFKNGGACTGPVRLMEDNDPFAVPNSMNVNVGNQITTLGSGNINAWSKNKGVGDPICDDCDKTEFVATCTAPIEPVVICVEFCDDSKEITQVTSSFDCSLTVLDDKCVRYTPLPGFETVGLDYLEIQGCDASGNCETVQAEVKVSSDCGNGSTNGGVTETNQIAEAERLDPNYSAAQWTEFLDVLFLPTVITPNGDGVNDGLTINNLDVLPANYTVALTVYDRTGREVFNEDTFNGNTGWNGKLASGTKGVGEGTYFYKFTINNGVNDLYTTFKYLEVRH